MRLAERLVHCANELISRTRCPTKSPSTKHVIYQYKNSKKESNLHSTRGIALKRVTSGGFILWLSSVASQLGRNVVAVASHWRHCVRFARPGNRVVDFRTRLLQLRQLTEIIQSLVCIRLYQITTSQILEAFSL